MFFVLQQFRVDGVTYERNVRIGGVKHYKSAKRMAGRLNMCLIRDEHRAIVGQSVNASAPNYCGVHHA